MKPDLIEEVTRYHLWYVPHFPISLPMVRPRERALPWRKGLLDSIRDEGLRHPILVYGHSPKGAFNFARWGCYQGKRDTSMYVAFGTNRYWALCQLDADYAPVIISLNKGTQPRKEWGEAQLVLPSEFKKYAPPGRVWVTDHSFGWELSTLPEEEFCPTADSQ
jgi:hypothetical protein